MLLSSDHQEPCFYFLGSDLQSVSNLKYPQKKIIRIFQKFSEQELREILRWLENIDISEFNKWDYSLINHNDSIKALKGILSGKSAYTVWPSNQRKSGSPQVIGNKHQQATIIFDGLCRKGYSKKVAYDLTTRITKVQKRDIDGVIKRIDLSCLLGEEDNRDRLVLCALRTDHWWEKVLEEKLKDAFRCFSK